MDYSQTILVIGGNHQNTLSIIRAVGSYGFCVHTIIIGCQQKNCYIKKSKYVTNISIINNDEELVPELLRRSISYSGKVVVFVCSDGAATTIDQNICLLESKYDVFRTKNKGSLTLFMKKNEQVSLAHSLGLKIPQTLAVTQNSILPENIVFPCILKPLSSADLGKRIDICSDINEVYSSMNSYPHQCQLLIQEYIEKDYEIVICGISSNGEVYLPGVVRKIRENKGNTSYSVTCPIDEIPIEIVDKIKKLVERIEYTGLFGVEFIVRNDLYYFVEINLRNDATTYSLVKSGVNLPYIYIRSRIAKEPLPSSSSARINQIYSMSEFPDLSNCIYSGISILRWIKDVLRAKCFYFFDINDMAPFRAALYGFIRTRVLNKAFRFLKL